MKTSLPLVLLILSATLLAAPQSHSEKSKERRTADSSAVKDNRQRRTSEIALNFCSVSSDRRGGVWLTGSVWSLRGLMINVRSGVSNVRLVPGVKSICQTVFVTTDVGWMVDARSLWKTSDSGMSWQKISVRELSEIKTVHFIDSQTGWIGGWAGEIFRTTDGGQTWQRAEAPLKYEIQQLQFVDSLHGWAVGYQYLAKDQRFGALFRTDDGGVKWSKLSNLNVDTQANIVSLFFLDRHVGWAIDQRQHAIVRTEDGGETWIVQEHGQKDSWNSLFFTDHLNGWVVGYGIAHTTDGGVTWKYQRNPDTATDDFHGITFTDDKRGWAVADDTIISTEDGGKTWKTFPDDWKRNLPDLQDLLNASARP
jgi:photosystem II stability/assembly factor-like uncharacterized protein